MRCDMNDSKGNPMSPLSRTTMFIPAISLLLAGCAAPVVRSERIFDPNAPAISGNPGEGSAQDGIEQSQSFAAQRPPALVNYALPLGVVPVTVTAAKVIVTMTLGETIEVADPEYMFSLSYEPSIWRSDDVQFDLTKDGLLTAAHTKVKDQSIAFVKDLVDVATKVITPSLTPAAARREEPAPPDVCKDFTLSGTVDPSSQDSAQQYSALLRERSDNCAEFSADIAIGNKADLGDKVRENFRSAIEKLNEKRQDMCNDAICFRTAIPYFFRLEHKYYGENSKENVTQQQIVTRYLPNGGPLGYARLDARPFIENEVDTSLTNGMLIKIHLVKPSEAVGPLASLGDLGKAIFAIPGALFRNETAELELAKKQLEAQGQLAKSESERIKAEISLDALRQCLALNPENQTACLVPSQ